MSLYRSVLAAIAAITFAAPVFADDMTATTDTTDKAATAPVASTENATERNAATTAVTEQTKVSINKATDKELMKVKGISSARAKSIISYRKKNGEFKSLDDLTKVTGFKNVNSKTLRGIQDQLTVE